MRQPITFQIKAIILVSFLLIAACKKTTVAPTLPIITIAQSPLVLSINDTKLYKLTAASNGVNLNQGDLLWSSDNSKIANVDDLGNVSVIGAGETTISATLTNGKGSAKCNVIVYDNSVYKIRLVLTDKGTSSSSISNPSGFLSEKAINRRIKEKIVLDNTDLPISTDYLRQIGSLGGKIVAQSKWLSTVCVYITDGSLINNYKGLPFVKDINIVWHQPTAPIITRSGFSGNISQQGTYKKANTYDANYYGTGWDNIRLENGQALHSQGFSGTGIDIAIIDAGFPDLISNSAFSNSNIKGAKNFLYENDNPLALDDHGLWVASCLASNQPGYVVGTAPDANYWLLVSEDVPTEYPIEEDYYVAALEYADSVGVDVINTSLIYKGFDDSSLDPKYEDFNGNTVTATRGVNMAFKKGMFIVAAAGNDRSWVATPAESPYVLATGAVDINATIASFSSFGTTADGRIKPDVVSLGANVPLIFGNFNGTSFASPITCGLVACLWQAYPKLNNKDLLDIMRKSADKYNAPLLPYGYGLPNMQKAMDLAKAASSTK